MLGDLSRWPLTQTRGSPLPPQDPSPPSRDPPINLGGFKLAPCRTPREPRRPARDPGLSPSSSAGEGSLWGRVCRPRRADRAPGRDQGPDPEQRSRASRALSSRAGGHGADRSPPRGPSSRLGEQRRSALCGPRAALGQDPRGLPARALHAARGAGVGPPGGFRAGSPPCPGPRPPRRQAREPPPGRGGASQGR